jgi:TM2 domain-containing membrane protein YozV
MKRSIALITSLSVLCIQALSAEEAESTAVIRPNVARYSFEAMPKDPLASLFFSATFPGLGQVYNKEYGRGIATGLAFWTSFFGAEYLLYRWQKINTDTFYVQDYFDEEVIHPVYVLKPDSLQVGLPTAEKGLLVAALIVGAGSYVFGIIDSYRGAKRFNRSLVACAPVKPSLYYSLGATRSEAGIRLNF